MAKIHVSVVVSAKNEAHTIAACLESLLEQESSLGYEILVVDNASTDDTAKTVKTFASQHKKIQLLRQKKPGSPAARNLGAHKAKGEVLLFTDADCTFAPNWLEKMARPFFQEQRLPLLALGGNTKGAFQNEIPNLWERYAEELFQNWESDREEAFPGFLPWAPTCNLAVRKDAFLALGGFEENWKSAAYDVDLCWRLILCGGYFGFVSDALVFHKRRSNPLQLLKQMENYAFYNHSLLRCYEKALHYPPVDTRKERWLSAGRRLLQNWKKTKNLKELSHRGIDSLVQIAMAKGVLRASLSPQRGSKKLDPSRKGECPALAPLIAGPYAHLHKEGWSYWKHPADLRSEGELILFQAKKRNWFRLNESAWKIWEVKAKGGQSEDAAEELGQSAENNEVLQDIDSLTLDLRRMHLLP